MLTSWVISRIHSIALKLAEIERQSYRVRAEDGRTDVADIIDRNITEIRTMLDEIQGWRDA